MLIYRILFPNGKSYVGQTSRSLEWRKSCHIYHAKKFKKTKIHNALNKYKKEDIQWVIIHDNINTIEELNKLEKKYIKEYNTLNNGYNLTIGGDGTIGLKWSDESRQKLSNSKKGITHSKESRRKMSEAKKGKPSPNKGKFGKDAPKYGKKTSSITREKQSRSAESRCKKFRAFNPDGEYIGTFLNMSKFERDYNIPRGTIRDVIIGRNNHSKGYTFKRIKI